jgi:hypothetical protein
MSAKIGSATGNCRATMAPAKLTWLVDTDWAH